MRICILAVLTCLLLGGALAAQEIHAPAAPAAEAAGHGETHAAPAAPAAGASTPGEAHAAPAAAGAHGGGGEHEPNLFAIDWTILISQTLNFFILLLVLQAFLIKPIGGILTERAEKIANDLKDIEERKAKAEAVKLEYQNRLAKIEEESYQIRQKAITEGQAAKDSLLVEAKGKADSLLAKAQVEINLERDKAWVQLKEKMVQLTMLAAEKVIDASLTDQIHRDLIKKTIDRLDQETSGETSH